MLLAYLIDLYSLVVLAFVILSWVPVDPRNPVVGVVASLTEPVLAPIRRMLPAMGGLDFSAMILLVVLQVVRSALSSG